MGQEIDNCNYTQEDFVAFAKKLDEETRLLHQMLKAGKFDSTSTVAGYELEAWLIDSKAKPMPKNDIFLDKLSDPEVVAELALFNIELNGKPRTLTDDALSTMQADLIRRWNNCKRIAEQMNLKLLAIGILPSVTEEDLCLDNMSKLMRYQALNQQVLALREGQPINLDIKGKEELKLKHNDVMLEAATTSFQLHLQVPIEKAACYYNLAKIVSAPTVAVSANSPYLFGKELWEETRIPLFEQSVSVGGSDYSRRVTFGVRYINDTIQEVFDANNKRYPILLPIVMNTPPEEFAHLRLHNGTLWRWNRPLVGFNAAGTPHIRIEHRVIPAGPTQVDQMANAAFFFGLITAMANISNPEQYIPHKDTKDNFYLAAKHGMHTNIVWLNNKSVNLQKLCLDNLLPLARQGLESLAIDKAEIKKYLSIIKLRLETGQTGASWQKQWVAKYGKDWQNLVLNYRENQKTGIPVHTWSL